MNYVQRLGDKVFDFVLDVSIRHIGYIIRSKGLVEELKENVEDLERGCEREEHKIVSATNNLKDIEGDSEDWVKKARDKIRECKEFQDDEAHTKTGCSRGILPFLWYRHNLGWKAKRLGKEVKTVSDKRPDEVSYEQNPRADADLYNAGYVELKSRKEIMKNIMEQLADPMVKLIGVCGPGGVGKTTLVNEVGKSAEDKNLFEKVVKVIITENPNLGKIQDEIAYHFGLSFEGESENGRAVLLRKRFKQENGNILVILDDLWGGLDLSMLGIPFDDDDFSQASVKDRMEAGNKIGKNEGSQVSYKGWKILLTSRFEEVLSNKMNIKQNLVFHVNELDDGEAKTLLEKVAKVESDKYSKFILEIVKHCAGLPMAILTVGKALRDKSELVWEDALQKLKRQELIGVQKYMEISVRLSYEQLESEELKSIFLLCAQMGHQPLIWDLVKYCFGLGILKGVHTLADARARISKSIQNLKSSSLLLDGNSSDNFNMHDLVREAALSIAHKEQNVFTLRNDKLEVWPDEIERCTVISLYKTDIVDELPEVLNCPYLKVFQIESDVPALNIPDKFFTQMEKLRVLILVEINLQSLPSSIKCLSNLRMLCLERCVLGDLSIIGNMKKLRILSLSESKIEKWPTELGDWSKLQLLDITNCTIHNLFPRNFISSLTNLEELYIRKSLDNMMVEEETNRSQISVLSELKHLHELKIIDICFPSSDIFPTDLFFDKLDDYKIVIGYFKTLSIGDFKMPNKYEASKSLALQLKAGTHIQSLKSIKMLFKKVENLLLGELNGVQNVFYELNMDGFPNLKNLSIADNFDIKYLVNSMEFSYPQIAFPNLESLNLFNLMNIEKICCSPLTVESFSRLKTIKIRMCFKLKNLFSFYIVKFLTSLENIEVSDCSHLKEIVITEEGEAPNNKVEFKKLCSLKLKELPVFFSFYTNKKSLSTKDHMEIVPAEIEQSLFGEKVEIPNLESLELSSIKIHKIWSDQYSSFYFQSLTKLIIKDCCNLKYICSLSVAKSLNKLKVLSVSKCERMEKLFKLCDEDSSKFSKDRLFPNLEEINLSSMDMLKDIWPSDGSPDSFGSLISLSIHGCNKVDKIFPSHTIGWCKNLDNLEVYRCDAVEFIFEINSHLQKDAFGVKLKLINLSGLSNLKKVWSRDPKGVANFTNLQRIEVYSCDGLRNVLPVSVAKGLTKLEELSISCSDGMEEITDAGTGTNNESLVFPELTYMNMIYLPNMKCMSRGRHIAKFPKLKQLNVYECPVLMFTTDSTIGGRSLFSAEEEISNLEYLLIGPKEAEWLKSNMGKYRMHRLKKLSLWDVSSVDILYWFLHRIPNLERLQMASLDSSIQEIVPSGIVLQLKELTLSFSAGIKDIGFERDPILQRIERLVLYHCSNLINLAHSTVSFTQLTYLEVQYCRGLKNLIASSTAMSLVRLTTMKVSGCDKLEEIVTNEENKEEERVVDIVFAKLITIEFESLTKLTSFCSYKNCKFSFPSLETLILRGCPIMKTFTEGHSTTPKLRNVLVIEEKEESKYWEGDLNSTVQKVSREYKSHLELSGYPELEQVWCGKGLVQENNFRNLKSLVMNEIDYLVHVIPSHLLPCFKNLEELAVRNCCAAQVIFNINDNARVTKAMGTFRLKKLQLSNLPQMEHVCDKDPEGIVDLLQGLRDLSVEDCNSLKYVFPPSLANNLAMLEQLSVVDCEQLVEIFAEDKTTSEGGTKSFVFDSLTSLTVKRLPEFRYFYSGLHKLEFSELKQINIKECKWMTLKYQEAKAYLEYQSLIPADRKVNLPIHNMEKLSFDIAHTPVTWHSKSHTLELFGIQSDNVVHHFLQMLPNVANLEVSYCSLKEVFSTERPEYVEVFSCLIGLRLNHVNDLKSIGLEQSWIHTGNLQTLEIKYCPLLKNLVLDTVSFSDLTNLTVSNCNNMLHLFVSSTAKSLTRLKEMEIIGCRSMTEIIIEQDDELVQGDGNIIFEHLQVLHLKDLPMLKRFYSGNYTLCFPLLKEVSIIGCLLMNTFCPNKDLLVGDGLVKNAVWEGNIYTTIRKMNEMNETMIAESARELVKLSLGDKPHFQEMWLGSMPVPDTWFSQLESLVVDGCEFLSTVLPYHLLPSLIKMQELEVRNCSSVKTVFDVKCISNDKKMTIGPALLPFLLSLKKLVLKNLPNLESVWNEDPDGVLPVEVLQEVHVDASKHHTSLKLSFPCLASLTLLNLPKLKCFYCSLHLVLLKRLEAQHAHMEDQPCDDVVTPNLANLSSGEKELKVICNGHKENSLHKVKVLDLQGLIEVELDCSERPNMTPSLIFFSGLMKLSISNCNDIIYLFTMSTAKNLTQLKKLDISSCKSMQEILSKEGDESHHDDEMIFGQLEELNLKSLPNLERFYKGNSTLSFPSLGILSVNDCSRMDNFCAGSINVKKLSAIRFYWNDASTPLEVDLNFSIHKIFKNQLTKFVKKVKDLKLIDKPEVHQIWHDSFPIPFLCFINLKSLIMERCEFLSTAIPSHVLSLLCKLEELEVRQCHSMKTIFGVKDIVKGKKKLDEGPSFSPSFRLKKLTFDMLPNLENVWDSDPREVIVLQNLKEVYVNGCGRLERLFPASVVKGLVKLEKLEVKQCGMLVEIVAKDKAVVEGVTKEFLIPCMTSIKLWSLPELKCFYPGPHKLECPKLNQVHLFHCDKFKTSIWESQSLPESQSQYEVGIPLYPQALFLDEKIIPYLDFLAISKEMAMGILHGEVDGNLFYKLQDLHLQCFHDDSDTFPYELFKKVPNVEKLALSCSSFNEIFSSKRPNADCDEEILSHLKCLQLSSLSKLNSIGLEHSWVSLISESLETLQIDQCHCLKNVVSCKVSFSSLIDLNVSQCGGLVYLFTPSTGRTLCQLKNMTIENCESLEEIVSGEIEESSNDSEEQIIFDKLETLSLQSLPKLGRFYSGSVALSFPSLEELSVLNCCKMESFCSNAVAVNMNKWTLIKFKEEKRAVPLKIDLNSAIQKIFDGTLNLREESEPKFYYGSESESE